MAQLVPLAKGHLEELRQIRGDPEIAKWLIFPSDISAVEQERWFERYLRDETYKIWVFVESGVVRGYGQLRRIDRLHRSAELGVVVAPNDQGSGRGRRIIRRLVAMARESMGIHRVWLSVLPDNERALKAYRACGFIMDGILRDAAFKDGEFRDLVVMSRLSDD